MASHDIEVARKLSVFYMKGQYNMKDINNISKLYTFIRVLSSFNLCAGSHYYFLHALIALQCASYILLSPLNISYTLDKYLMPSSKV